MNNLTDISGEGVLVFSYNLMAILHFKFLRTNTAIIKLWKKYHQREKLNVYTNRDL